MAKAEKIENLECQDGAAKGARLVIETRFKEMWMLRDEALTWADPEGVHNMRVASRRLRSALQDFSSHLPQLKLKKLQKNVRFIARSLGGVRDLDVSIASLEALAKDAPAEFKAGIERITEHRRRRLDAARGELQHAIDAKAAEDSKIILNRLIAKWPVDGGVAGIHTTFAGVGRDVIIHRAEDLRSLSVSLYRPLKTEPLHELRILAKRLRYALELFSLCWPQVAALDSFALEVSKLQTQLGDLHDCDEWISEFSRELRHRDGLADDWVASAHWLLGTFAKKRGKAYASSLMIWQEWERMNWFEKLNSSLAAQSYSGTSLPSTNISGVESMGEPDEKPCQHGICNCIADEGGDYCGPYCQDASQSETVQLCDCGHPTCVG